MQYRPFAERLPDVRPEQLAALRETHEGWYVEYKSDLIRPRDLAKSMSSFANQHGGWLFLGVRDDPDTLVADSFPGIPDEQVPEGVEALRNAAKDLLNPSVDYEHRVFAGPIDSIGLEAGRSILAVQIPRSVNTPHIHNDGRIYQRIGDSSQPTPISDRSTFDMLARRAEEARKELEELVLWTPTVSEGEQDSCYIHLIILSDPYGVMGHRYEGDFQRFVKTMREKEPIPFDNFFSMNDGYIARQTESNDPDQRILTWHLSNDCTSFITMPIPILRHRADLVESGLYPRGTEFGSLLSEHGLEYRRIVDLNIIPDFCVAAINRHRQLVEGQGARGPSYMKARLENIWRTIPFIDHPEYLDHVGDYGVPLVQHDRAIVPSGTAFESFWSVPETIEVAPGKAEPAVAVAFAFSVHIFNALGIPLGFSLQSIPELTALGGRRLAFQRGRQGQL